MGLTALNTGANILRETTQSAAIIIIVLLRLKSRRNAIGLRIAKYLSILIAVIVNTDAATATPVYKLEKKNNIKHLIIHVYALDIYWEK